MRKRLASPTFPAAPPAVRGAPPGLSLTPWRGAAGSPGSGGAHLAGCRLHQVTLEHDAPQVYPFPGGNPGSLVVDIEGVEFDSVLDSLARKVATDDPHQAPSGRGASNRGGAPGHGTQGPGGPRSSFQTGGEPWPPFGTRRSPSVEARTLLALLEGKREAGGALQARCRRFGPGRPDGARGQAPEVQTSGKSAKPVVDRLVTITLDPGHGGETPERWAGRYLRKPSPWKLLGASNPVSRPNPACGPC